MPNDIDWLIVGDCNYVKYSNMRNYGQGDHLNNMMIFNEAISELGPGGFCLKAKINLGALCRNLPFLKDQAGFSPLNLGPLNSLTLFLSPLLGLSLIIPPVLYKMKQTFPCPIYSDQKTTGCNTLNSKILSTRFGSRMSMKLIAPKSLLQNSKDLGKV